MVLLDVRWCCAGGSQLRKNESFTAAHSHGAQPLNVTHRRPPCWDTATAAAVGSVRGDEDLRATSGDASLGGGEACGHVQTWWYRPGGTLGAHALG